MRPSGLTAPPNSAYHFEDLAVRLRVGDRLSPEQTTLQRSQKHGDAGQTVQRPDDAVGRLEAPWRFPDAHRSTVYLAGTSFPRLSDSSDIMLPYLGARQDGCQNSTKKSVD